MSSEIRIQHFFRCEHCRMPHRADVPLAVDDLVLAMLAKEPEHRLSDHAALLRAIDAVLEAIERPEEDAEPTLASGGHRF